MSSEVQINKNILAITDFLKKSVNVIIIFLAAFALSEVKVFLKFLLKCPPLCENMKKSENTFIIIIIIYTQTRYIQMLQLMQYK